MQLRECNVNTQAGRLAGARKPAVLPPSAATYISPPRNPTAATIHARQQQQQQPQHQQMSRGSLPSSTATANDDATRAMTTGESYYNNNNNNAAIESGEMYAEGCEGCPCPTCAYYRTYYAHPMVCMPGGNVAAAAAAAAAAAVAAASAQHEQQQKQHQQQQQQKMNAYRAPVGVYNGYVDPERLENETGPARMDAPNVPQSNVLETFYDKFYQRVVETACTANGKCALQSLLRSLPVTTAKTEEETQQAAEVFELIVREVCDDIDTIAVDSNGCHVLRAVLYTCTAEQMADIVSSFHETLVLNLCTMSIYTRRVLQTIFGRGLIDVSALVEVLAKNASYLAATEQGCISLMRAYESCDAQLKAMIMEPLLPTFVNIAMDPFGNYVVQCAIEKSDIAVAAHYCVTCFTGHLLTLSCNKFGSNVVEKIIQCCYTVPAVHHLLLDELVFNPAAVHQLVPDSFGNFVVQRIIENTTNPKELRRVADRLHLALPHSRFSVKIEAKLKLQRTQTQQQQLAANASQSSFSLPSFQTPAVQNASYAAYSPPPQQPPSYASTASITSLTAESGNASGTATVAKVAARGWHPPHYTRRTATATPASSSTTSI